MKIPASLGVRAWQLDERAGCIFARHDPEQGEPTYALPAQTPGDGPFRQYRLWYSQFYAPRSRTAAIQQAADAVIDTNEPFDAPWIALSAGNRNQPETA
jgi:hypothetical protein